VGTTRELAEFAHKTSFAALPGDVVHETKRDIINVLGVSLYSARDPSLQAMFAVFDAEGGNQRASIWGTGRKTTLQFAALANGYLGHLEDYDDTHFPTVIHPTSPTLPAAFAIGEAGGASGQDLIAAVALGIEICCRAGNAVYPWHYDAGWHITGTMGMIGAAIAGSKIAGLDVDGIVRTMGIAGTQAAGVREAFGTMTKPMHAGRAAQAGVVSTMLSQGGFTAAPAILEGRRGVFEVMSTDRELSRATEGLGETWEIFQNGLKPYSCGVVSHPLIDAAVALRSRPGFDAGAIESIDAYVHPLVPELMGKAEPQVGLESKFSSYHCVAIGLVDGAGFPEQFSDARARDPQIDALRRKVKLNIDESKAEDACRLVLHLKDGSELTEEVTHATGSPQNPLSDQRLEEKFLALATPTIGESAAKTLLDRLWHLDEAASIAGLVP
jgi:2-methylcitrate dehydratase PrpD